MKIGDDGSYIETRRVTITFRFLGDEVIITKTFEHGGEIVIRVEEAGEFYRADRNGFIYTVKFVSGGVELYDDGLNLLATVIFNDDGSYTITYPDGSEEAVSL